MHDMSQEIARHGGLVPEAQEKHRQEVERVQRELRERREQMRLKERQRLESKRAAAKDADRALEEALRDLDSAATVYETTKREGAALIAEADSRFEAALILLNGLREQVAKAEAQLARCEADAASARQMFDVESSRAAYDEALEKARLAVKAADEAWGRVSKGYRKANRDRALRKRARDLGLTSAPGEE